MNKKVGNLNLFLLDRLSSAGKEVRKFVIKNTVVGALIENPLTKLLKKDLLTREEYSAGMQYCRDYELANISHHARPSYDGTSISSARPNRERTLPDSQLKASARIERVKARILLANISERLDSLNSKKPRTKDKKLPQILELIFQNQISIRAAEKQIGMNHQLIEERVKEICEIILKIN